MSKTNGNVIGLWSRATRRQGIGKEQVVAKGNRTTEEEASYFHNIYEKKDESADTRKEQAATMVDTFYDLVTDFYESGWGQSFHFAPRGLNETFRESLCRHEYYIAAQLKMSEKDKVLDCGCGIGGPMRNIAQFTNADITGITINSYQVKRGNTLNRAAGLSKICRSVEMDFLKMDKFQDNTFDKCFSIEATCHAGRREDVFSQVFRVLKPGGLFATYEWVLTDKYDPKNLKHVKARQMIEKGNALPELISAEQSRQKFEEVGFELLNVRDLADPENGHGEVPWYSSLQASCSWENLPQSRVATSITHVLCWVMESVGLAAKGTLKTHDILITAKEGLVAAGEMGIFTPALLLVGRKPEKSD